MNDLDSFLISDYENDPIIKPSNDQRPEDERIDDAIEWATDAMRTIIIPTDNLDDLEDQWLDFNDMPKKHRRESDWKSIELFGDTNKNRYEKIRRDMLRDDIENDIESDIDLIDDPDIPIFESVEVSAADSYYNPDIINYTSEDVEKAIAWANEANRIIITPTRSLEELETLWESFNSMIKKHRRESDWKSEEIFGISNLHHYEYIKSQFLREDISKRDTNNYGSIIESTNIMRNYSKEVIREESIPDAARVLIEAFKPTGNLYEDTIATSVVSDIVDNFEHISSFCTSVGDIIPGDLPYLNPDEMIDMGIFAQNPEDNYYGFKSDNNMLTEEISVKEWFESYKTLYKHGQSNKFNEMNNVWISKVRELMFGLSRLKETGSIELINSRKQSILELGWDPDIEFNQKSRMVSRELLKENFKTREVQIIDLTKFTISEAAAAKLTDNDIIKDDHELLPVFVILTEGKSAISGAIKKFTNSIYSHASISLDPTLKHMYSFNLKNGVNKFGGFIEENIKKLRNDQHVNVFAFFVPKNIFNRIKERLEEFKNNVKDTAYSVANLIGFMFNIPMNRDKKFICSQFVDNTLKLAGANIDSKDSSLVSPADLDKHLSARERIYNIYNGIGVKYNASKIKILLDTLRNGAKPITESMNIYIKNESTYLAGLSANINNLDYVMSMKDYRHLINSDILREALNKVLFDNLEIVPYREVKEFPVQFDAEGNLLINNIGNIDYEEEYAKSHKLLRQYHRYSNTDGMKYELSKLWMMLCTIENKLHKNSRHSKTYLYNAKAKIMNDFKYYLDELLKIEPEFNFTKYYENTPFGDATLKINKTTIDGITDLIKKFISPM